MFELWNCYIMSCIAVYDEYIYSGITNNIVKDNKIFEQEGGIRLWITSKMLAAVFEVVIHFSNTMQDFSFVFELLCQVFRQ